MKTPRDSDRSSSAPSAKKRRNMNPLSINAHESRYSETSQTKEYYLETRGREELSPESIRRQSKRNRENKLKGLNLHDILYSSDPIIPDRENLKGRSIRMPRRLLIPLLNPELTPSGLLYILAPLWKMLLL
jgi:hypothetical protein